MLTSLILIHISPSNISSKMFPFVERHETKIDHDRPVRHNWLVFYAWVYLVVICYCYIALLLIVSHHYHAWFESGSGHVVKLPVTCEWVVNILWNFSTTSNWPCHNFAEYGKQSDDKDESGLPRQLLLSDLE